MNQTAMVQKMTMQGKGEEQTAKGAKKKRMRAKKKRMKTNQKITQMTKSKTFLGAYY